MRRWFSVAFLLAALTAMAADLKQSVVLVEPEYGSMRSFLDEYSLVLSREGYRAESKALMNYRGGVSGSGVVLREGQHLLVVTNQHVVGLASQVCVSVENGKNRKKYEHCPVLAVSHTTDLALIALPDSAEVAPLVLCDAMVDEASEVFAAGFPSLAGKPSWQITKGIVSNNALYHKDLLGEDQAAIQHTAPIDGGSSGGPLLVQKDGGYAVVGINTWKAGRREGVGIAIPVSAVQQILEREQHLDTKTDAQRSREWNELIRTDLEAAAQSLSVEYLMTRSADEWVMMARRMKTGLREQLDDYAHHSPIDAIRYVFAAEMRRVALAGGEESPLELEWREVQGEKAIVSVVFPTLTSKQKKNGKKAEEKFTGAKARSYRNGFDSSYDMCHSIRLDYANYLSRNQRLMLGYEWAASVFVGGGHIGVQWEELIDEANGVEAKPTLGLGLDFGLRFPIQVSEYHLIPRVGVSPTFTPLMMVRGDAKVTMELPITAGLDFAIPVGAYAFTIGVNAGYDLTVCLDGVKNLHTSENGLRTRKVLTNGKLANLLGQFGLGLSAAFCW